MSVVFHVKKTGTKTTGASTPGSWLDSNCYSDIQTAWSKSTTSGDTVVLDDDNWNLITFLKANSVNLNGDGETVITSRSEAPETCSITQTTNTYIAALNNSTYIYDVLFSGIALKHTFPGISVQGAGIWTLQKTGNVTVENAIVSGFDFNFGATAHVGGPIFRCDNLVAGSRVFKLDTCLIDDISIATSADGTGICGTDVATDLQIIDTQIQNIDYTVTGNNNSRGLFYIRKDHAITRATLSDITKTHAPGSTGSNYATFYQESAGISAVVDTVKAERIAVSGGAIHGFLNYFAGTYEVKNLDVSYCTAEEEIVNGLGGALVSYGDGASGTYEDSEIYSCESQHGTAFYGSQGGSGVIKRVVCRDNIANGRGGGSTEPGGGGAIYSGGWGDLALEYCTITGNKADEGAGVYSHSHSESTRNKTTDIKNCTIEDNVLWDRGYGLGGVGCVLKGSDDVYTNTVTMQNVIVLDGGVDEILGLGVNLILNIDSSFVDGGAGAITGADTFTNEKTTLPAVGTILTGIHDQPLPATDINKQAVVFTPYIGSIDGRTTLIVDTPDYTPTGWDVRAGATLVLTGGGAVNLSGLTDTGKINVVANGPITSYLSNGTETVISSGIRYGANFRL